MARADKSLTCCKTSGVTTVDFWKISPPATTRCPTPVISVNSSTIFNRFKSSSKTSTASV